MDEGSMKLMRQWNEEMAADPGIPLWPRGETPKWRAEAGQPEPAIVPFLVKGAAEPRGAVIVCPGGGYAIKAPHEGRPIARMLNAAGIHAFVLDYRLSPYTIDCTLMDAQRAIRVVRHRSAEWGVMPDKIGILGFSAGSHLTIMASTHFDSGNGEAADPVERESCRPDAQVPCYPLVSLKPVLRSKGGRDWARELVDPQYTPESVRWTFGDECVRPDTPPAFLWGTDKDFLLAQWPPYLKALGRNKVPFEYHVFRYGEHGLGLAEETPLTRQWPGLCAAWLLDLGF